VFGVTVCFVCDTMACCMATCVAFASDTKLTVVIVIICVIDSGILELILWKRYQYCSWQTIADSCVVVQCSK